MRRDAVDTPLGVWAAALVVAGLLIVGTFLQPLFHVPDERYHVDMIFAGLDGGWPAVQQRTLSPEIVASGRLLRVDVASAVPLPRRPAKAPVEPVCRPARPYPDCRFKPTFEELTRSAEVTGPVNRMAQHPPAYYLLAGQMVATTSSLAMRTVPYDAQVWLYRLVSVLLVVPVPLLCAWAVRATDAPVPLQVAAAGMPATVVGLTFRNGAIVNNDNLLMLLVSIMLVLLVRTYQEGLTRRRAVQLGLLAGLSMLTKGLSLLVVFALPLSLWAIHREAAVGVANPSSRWWIDRLVPMAGMALLAGGWWPVRNLLWYGTPQPAGGSRPPAGDEFQPDIMAWYHDFAVNSLRTGLGSTGTFLVEHPLVLVGIAGVVLTLFVVGARALGWRLTLALNLPLVVTYVIWATNSYLQYTKTGVVAAGNARYYYPMIVGVVVVLVAGMRSISVRFRVPAPVWPSLVWAVVIAVTLREAHVAILGRWSDLQTYADGVAALRAWAPAPFAIMQLAALAAVLGALVALVQPWLRWFGRRT